MLRVALRMLFGDRAKYLSLALGLAFAVLLITQQGSIFLGLMLRATGPLQNVSQPDLWVTDPFVKWVSETRALSDADLNRVRSVPGVAWAELGPEQPTAAPPRPDDEAAHRSTRAAKHPAQ